MVENLLHLWESTISQDNIWWQLAVAGLIFLLALLVKGLFARFMIRAVYRLTSRTGTDLDRCVMEALEGPLKGLILAVGLYAALNYLPLPPAVMVFVVNLFRSAIIVFIAWAFYNLVGGEAAYTVSDKLNLDRTIADFGTKVLRFIIVALAFVVIAQEWNYDVNGLLAGLGLGGLAFALAAKDAIANIFGGIVIILDKPFAVGDWILTPSVEGTVEEMSFRSTKVRTFANALVTVPNSVLANQAVTNWTRMQKRRISFHLGVTYDTPRAKLRSCVDKIKAMLENHPEVHPDMIMVRFEHFSDSSLDIFIYFFTKTTAWAEYLKVREEINFKIMEIIEEEGVSVAFPSQSVYFENKLEMEQKQT